MGIYILIKKSFENEDFAEYEFGRNEQQTGKLKVIKNSGQIILMYNVPEDEPDFVFRRAARKIQQHWEKGEFPDNTCWAS